MRYAHDRRYGDELPAVGAVVRRGDPRGDRGEIQREQPDTHEQRRSEGPPSSCTTRRIHVESVARRVGHVAPRRRLDAVRTVSVSIERSRNRPSAALARSPPAPYTRCVPDSDLGEFALIDRIVARLGDAAAREIIVPPGDDAAVWAVEGGGAVVASTDALVEGNHWRRDTMSMADVGWRAIAANVSDIAAMGATPQYALVVAVLAPALTLDDLDAFMDGMAEACRCHDVRVAGGDIVRGKETAFAVALLGNAALEDGRASVLRRDAATVGDAVAVSGTPGASAAGLALIEAGREAEPGAAALLAAHRRPVARVALGRAAVEVGVACAIDVSDGLLQDLGHVAERSEVGVEIDVDSLPIHPAALALLGEQRARDLALGGGEDFELALTAAAEMLTDLSTPELPVTVIGRVVADHPGEAWAVASDGRRYQPPSAGWDQLRTPERP